MLVPAPEARQTDRQTGQGEKKPNGVGTGEGLGEGCLSLEMRPEEGCGSGGATQRRGEDEQGAFWG